MVAAVSSVEVVRDPEAVAWFSRIELAYLCRLKKVRLSDAPKSVNDNLVSSLLWHLAGTF
jgi:hypothetical protein